jgi:hypothetical protein
VNSSGTVADGRWQHVALVSDGAAGTETVYLDDQIIGPASGSPSDFGGSFNQIGTGYTAYYFPYTNGDWYGFQGQIDDVRIWSVARSAAEIEQDMTTAATGTEPGLEAYYRFDERTGTTAFDATPNHRDATMATRGNSLPTWVSNASQAIDLGGDGVTYPAASLRQGPNHLQNYPVIASTDNGRIQGWLRGAAATAYDIEFFASSRTSPSGSGDAEQLLESIDVTTDSAGVGTFDVAYTPVAGKPAISATATDPAGNTSEVSAPRRPIVLDLQKSRFHERDVVPITFAGAAGTAISVVDPEADPFPNLELTITASAGTLALSGTAGLIGTGNGTAAVDYRGLASDLTSALAGMRFDPPAGFSGDVTISLVAQLPGQAPVTAELNLEYGAYFVTTTADSGPGSLRQAIIDANAGPGLDRIDFAIAASGVQVIAPASALPAITDPLVIDGFSQPGYAGTPLVEISGQSAGTAAGLTITCAGSAIRGLAIDGFASGAGIVISGPAATGNVIAANFIGTDPTGSQARPNGLGISISGGAHDDTIGGTVALGNLITDNTGSGIVVTSNDSVGNRILGNRIFDDGRVTPTPTTRLRFDGSNYVSLPNNLVSNYENAETIEAWFQTTTDGVILGYQTTDPSQYPSNGYVPALYVGTDGRLYGEVWSGSINQVTSNGQVNDGHWHQAALVSDSQDSTESLYVDGRFVMSVSGSAQDFGGSFDEIGTGQTGGWPSTNGGWYGFNGQIDDVRIWSVARSAGEIQQDMATAARGSEPGLEAYYRFDEATGTTAFDAKANHRDGTLMGAGGSLPARASGTVPSIDLGAPSIFPDGHEALQFDGSGSFVQLPSLTLGGALTLEAWVESDNVHANFARVFDFGD